MTGTISGTKQLKENQLYIISANAGGSYSHYGYCLTSNSITISSSSPTYAWQTDYDANVDPYNMGNTWGQPRRNLAGGMYNYTTNCGTRSMQCNAYPYSVATYIASRGCNERVLSWDDDWYY